MLHKLGFHLPADVGKVYPRIPHFWSADHIYSVASKIGPVDTTSLQFSMEDLERISNKEDSQGMVASDGALEELGKQGGVEEDDFESMDLLGDPPCSSQTNLSSGRGGWLNMALMSKQLGAVVVEREQEEQQEQLLPPDTEFMDMD